MLAFDVDGPTGDAMLDGSIWRNPAYFTLGAYGPWRALGYLLDLLQEYRVPTTFFVPAWVIEHWPAQCRAILERGHEVGYHGYRHEAFWQLTRQQQSAVMARSLALFRQHLGVDPVGFRTPSGDWGPDTIEVLLDAGVQYSSSMRGDDRPYLIASPASGRSLIEIPAAGNSMTMPASPIIAIPTSPQVSIGSRATPARSTTGNANSTARIAMACALPRSFIPKCAASRGVCCCWSNGSGTCASSPASGLPLATRSPTGGGAAMPRALT